MTLDRPRKPRVRFVLGPINPEAPDEVVRVRSDRRAGEPEDETADRLLG